MNKQLFRSNTNKMIGGVCGGIAEYLSISPDIIRVLWVLFSLMYRSRIGFFAYLICIAIIPKSPIGYHQEYQHNFSYKNLNTLFDFSNKRTKFLIGSVFIALGTILALKKVFSLDDIFIYSIFFILIGVYLIIKGGKE